MKEIAHMEIVGIVANQIGGIDREYIEILKRHASDPDPGPNQDSVNKLLAHLKKEDGVIDMALANADVTKVPLEHSHDYAPKNAVVLKEGAEHKFEIGDTKAGFLLLSWATHFIVDSGTPYHKNSVLSYSEVLGNHVWYENYVDKKWNVFGEIVRNGCSKEARNPMGFSKKRVEALARYSGSLFDKLNSAVNERNYKQINSITRACINEIAKCTYALFDDLRRKRYI